MYTYILTDDQVFAYLKDYVDRFIVPFLCHKHELNLNIKVTIVALGNSGLELYRHLPPIIHSQMLAECHFAPLEKFSDDAVVINAFYDKVSGDVQFRDDNGLTRPRDFGHIPCYTEI